MNSKEPVAQWASDRPYKGLGVPNRNVTLSMPHLAHHHPVFWGNQDGGVSMGASLFSFRGNTFGYSSDFLNHIW